MENSELSDRLKKVGLYTFVFFICYMVIGFFLLSEYPICTQPFNGKVAYDILRDSLTLSAYFLAPAVAYVLFSDWRVQYEAIKKDEFYNELDLRINELFQKAEDLAYDITMRSAGDDFFVKISRKHELLDDLLKEVYRKIAIFKHPHDQLGQMYVNHANDLVLKISGIYFQILFIKGDLSRLNSGIESDILAANATLPLNKQKLEVAVDEVRSELHKLTELKPVI